MGVQRWNEETFVVRVGDDPELSDDMTEVGRCLGNACCDVVLDLTELTLLTSGGLSRLLRLRKGVVERGRRLVLCAAGDGVWSVFLATGLDAVFEFTETVAEALARLQGGKT